jgi:hypothetical protein
MMGGAMESEILYHKNTEAAIMARLIQSRTEMDAHVARYLLSFDFEPDDIRRMNLLAERAQAGNLSQEEAAELDSYLHVGNLLTMMQSKARRFLREQNDAPSRQ